MKKKLTSIIVGAGHLTGFCADRSRTENTVIDVTIRERLESIERNTSTSC